MSARITVRIRPVPAVALGAIALIATGCKPNVGDPLGLGSRLAPFERLPYLQAVDSSSASVRWLAYAGVRDSAEFRVGREGTWTPLAVTRFDERTTAVGGPVATRRARITGLPPGQEISYRVWADSTLVGPFVFRTAPRPEDPRPVRVLAFGDSGYGSEPQIRLADLMQGLPFDLAVHTGDIAYQVGSEEDFTIRHFQVYRTLLSRLPFFPSVGNHDIRVGNGGPYDRAFEWTPPDEGARFYAFRWGSIAFLALDTTDEEESDWPEAAPGTFPFPKSENDGPPTDGALLRQGRGRQYDWLARELEAAQADPGVRWTIVYMHHPPYSHVSGLSGHGSDGDLEREIAPLFDRYGVDLVLSGHDHHYERSLPLYDDEVARPGCGPVYIVTGGGGASRFARGLAPSTITAAASRSYHFVQLEIGPDAISGQATGEQGQRIDEFIVLPYRGDEPGARGRQRRPESCR